jgi:hypothetical protein
MPYIVVQSWYPSAINIEVTEKYLEVLKEFPFDRSLGKETIPIAATATKNGIEIISVMEVKQGKLEEAWTWIGKRLAPFQAVTGFEYEVKLWTTLTEAFQDSEYTLPT